MPKDDLILAALRDESVVRRFLSKIDRCGPDECWEWNGARTRNGYGCIRITPPLRGVTIYAHRMSWMRHHGRGTDGLLVTHACDNRSCCNPAHLRLGTQKQNIQECIQRGRFSFNVANLVSYGQPRCR